MMILYRLLGPAEIAGATRTVRPATHLRRGLLAALLLHCNQAVTYDRLVDILWDRPPISARPNLRNHLADLRRDLEAAQPCLSLRIEVHRAVRGTGGALRLRADRHQVDVMAADQLGAAARHDIRAGQSGRALRRCRRALGLWRGDFATDLPRTDWFADMGVAILQTRFELAVMLHTSQLLTGDHGCALIGIRALLADRPHHDRLWQLSVAAHFLAGDIAAALQQLRDCADRYRDLGLDTPAKVAALQRPILRQDHDAIIAELRRW